MPKAKPECSPLFRANQKTALATVVVIVQVGLHIS